MNSIIMFFLSTFISSLVEVNGVFDFVIEDRGLEGFRYQRIENVDGDCHLVFKDLTDDTINSIEIEKKNDEYFVWIHYSIAFSKDDYLQEDYDYLGVKKIDDEYKIRYLGE